MTPLLGTTPKCNDHLKKKKKQTYEESNVKTFSKAFMNLVSITASVCDLFPSLHEAIKLFFFGNGTVIKFEWKKKKSYSSHLPAFVRRLQHRILKSISAVWTRWAILLRLLYSDHWNQTWS